ncbi:MAG TPA: Gfo/Idh/MocA family oxidoreductase [Armatimonadota bacterium]|nr:Gfo/Idh/MocA family oxidoreductase [Armatimonadota bacterium]
MSRHRSMTRRTFLARSAALAAIPYVVPSGARGADGSVAPSERITMGAIGIGGRGTYDLQWFMRNPDVRFVAMCDARRDRREAAKALVDQAYGNTDCATYIDPREMLARDDIDAVLIATSDRWHAMASIMAMRAGKDVFSEKPCAMNVGESQALAETAREFGRIFQAGTQRRSEPNFVFIVQLARLGYLGKLKTLTAHIVHGFAPHVWLPAQPEPPKDEVDYDLYLGPVPWHPYNRGYVDSRHAHADLWAGGLHEWGAHTFDLCQFANDTAHTGPVEFVYPNNDTSEGLTARYANGVELVMTASGFPGTCGVRFTGEDGVTECSDGHDPTATPASLLGERDRILRDYVAKTRRSLDHVRDFLDCVKSGRQPIANADVARKAHNICHVGAICMALKRDLRWDPDREEFIGDDEANRMRFRANRAPWVL